MSDLTNFALLDSKLSSLAPLGEHPTLERLQLYSETCRVDISPLSECQSLRAIDMPLRAVADNRQLRSLAHVRELHFSDDALVPEILANLGAESRLLRFGIWEARSVTGLGGLVTAPQLETLEFLLLADAYYLNSIAGVERWAETVTGILLEARKLTDVDRISSLPLLEFANLVGTPIRSLDFLRGNSRLARLHIGGMGQIPSLTPLCDISALRDLHIWGYGPVDVSELAGATNLTVHVMGNNRRSIHGREKLPDSVEVRRSAH
jgi:hypothetical protein